MVESYIWQFEVGDHKSKDRNIDAVEFRIDMSSWIKDKGYEAGVSDLVGTR
ncbi:MAG: hypothetical protein ACRD5J_15585 [Nitrososphaeraceae archaeon]